MQDPLAALPADPTATHPSLGDHARRFRDYVAGFSDPDPDRQAHYHLKWEHTWRVVGEADRLAGDLDPALGVDRSLVLWAGLYHDLGRFPQFRDHGTFHDDRSVDHAWLAVRELARIGFTADLPPARRRLLWAAVALHSRPRLNPGLRRPLLALTGLLRDADKLDIIRQNLVQLELPADGRHPVFRWRRPHAERCNPELVAQVRAGGLGRRDLVKSWADYVLLLAGWVHDLNCPTALAALRDRGWLAALLGYLPVADRDLVAPSLNAELERRLAVGPVWSCDGV